MIYLLLRIIFTLYLRIFHLAAFRGTEHIPASGPVILCANHSSYLDSMLMGLATRRRVTFMIIRSFYRHPLLGLFIRGCGAIPVSQNAADRESMRRALEVLERGGVIGIFPEGRLSTTGNTGEGRPGAALLAALSGAPIVPVTISGAFRAFPKGRITPRPARITVDVHPQLTVEPGRERDREYLRRVTDVLMGRIGRRLRTRGRLARRQRRRYGSKR